MTPTTPLLKKEIKKYREDIKTFVNQINDRVGDITDWDENDVETFETYEKDRLNSAIKKTIEALEKDIEDRIETASFLFGYGREEYDIVISELEKIKDLIKTHIGSKEDY